MKTVKEMVPIKKCWLFAVIAAIVLALALMIEVTFQGKRDVAPVTEPSFALNGEDYPLAPVLQDFIDRGWKQGRAVEWTGGYTEETGVTNVVPTGYKLISGNHDVNVYLDAAAHRAGVEPSICRVRSLSVYGYDVNSFCIDGKELSDIDSAGITELLGKPANVEKREYGESYYYSMPEKGIDEISFTFLYARDSVSQIFIIFEASPQGDSEL